MLKKFLIGTFVAMALMLASTAFASYDFGPSTLKVGSSGDYVKTLQTLVGATADGSFGPMTKAKVQAWQAANGLVADGMFGNLSKAKANLGLGGTVGTLPAGCTAGALFSSTTGASCTTVTTLPAGCTAGALFSSTTGAACTGTVVVGGLTGGAGNISTLTKLSTYNDEKMNEGDSAKVLAFEVKADNGSDLNLTSLKLKFTHASTGSYRMDRYMNNVSVYMGSTKVGTADVADFIKNTADNTYSGSISLAGVKIPAGQKTTLSVGVTANTTIDSVDQDSGNLNWTVATVSVRYNDATGAILTDTTVVSELVGFTSITNSGDLALKASEVVGTNPIAQVVTLSETTTTVVPMLSFKLKAEGANMDITKLQFEAATSGDSDGIGEMVSDWELFKGSDSIATYDATNSTAITTATSGTIIFSDISGLTLTKDTYTTFTVKATMKKIGTGADAAAFDQGDSVTLSLDGTNFKNVTKTLAETTTGGDTVATGYRTGAVTGNAQTFRSKGINATLVSTSATVATGAQGAKDVGTFTITFDVTAFGSDVYVDGTKPSVDGTSGTASTVTITGANTPTEDAIIRAPGINIVAGGTLDGTATYYVPEGTTQRFVITSIVTPGSAAAGLTSVQLTSLAYALTNVDSTTEYTTNLGSFVTPSVNLKYTN